MQNIESKLPMKKLKQSTNIENKVQKKIQLQQKQVKIVRRLAIIFISSVLLTKLFKIFIFHNTPLPIHLFDGFADTFFLFLIFFTMLYFFVQRPVSMQTKENLNIQEKMHECEKRINFYINNSPLATIKWNSEFQVKQWSGKSELIFGWKEIEVIGKKISELHLISEIDIPLFNITLEKLFNSNDNNLIATIRNITKDGKIITCEWHNLVLLDENGKIDSIISQVLDVSDLNLDEKSLKTNEELITSVFQKAPFWITIINLENDKYIEVNEAALRDTYFLREEVIGHTPEEINWIEKKDRDLLVSEIKNKGRIVDLEMTFRTKDSRLLHVLVNGEIIIINNQTCLLTFTANMTERKIFENLRIESEKKFRLLFMNMNAGFALHEIIKDDKGKPCDYRFLEINPAFEAITGLNSTNIIGKTVMEVLPNTEAYWVENYGKVALEGKTIHLENFSSALNKYFQVNVYSPEIGKFVTIIHDVTELRRAELKKKQVYDMQQQLLLRMTEAREEEKAIYQEKFMIS